MIKDNDMVKVTNRANWTVAYKVPELGVHRRFAMGESKMLSAGELRKLAWLNGGRVLLEDHLVIDNEELVNELLHGVEPEYYYTTEDVVNLLTYGTEDQLRDALDFAPAGVVSLIKDMAVETKLNDMRKRDIIMAATGFDVTNAIRINEESKETEAAEVKQRRAAPINAAAQTEETSTEAPARRTEAPKYKVTSTLK